MQSSLARQTHRKCSRLTHLGNHFPQFNGHDKNVGSKTTSFILNVIPRSKSLAGSAPREKSDIVMSMVPVQPVLCAEPFYCYHWNSLTSSCPVVSTPAAPGNLANTRTLQGYRAANPSLRNPPQSPEPSYSSVGHGSS